MEKSSLNILNFGYIERFYPRAIGYNIKNFFRNIRWSAQRITKGYCAKDAWDIDYHLSALIAAMLEDLAKNSHTYPGNEEFPTPESWEKYLLELSHDFYRLNECTYDKNLSEEERDAIFLRLSKIWHNLWD